MPILSLAIFLIKTILLAVIYLLWGLILSPLLVVLYGVFLGVQRIFRTITDKIMLFLISKLGRTPSRNSAIARKISGPGMSRSYFLSIGSEDVYVLTLCKL